LTGIPIDPAFSERPTRRAAEHLVGLPEADFRILLMGGGLGIGPIEELTRLIMNLDVPLQVVVVAGRNKKLYARLSGIGKKVISFGYVDTIPLLMAASDLCLTKPGGLTIAEAAAMGVPTLLFDPVPGHEEANIETLVREGAAFRIAKVERAPELVNELRRRPSLLRKMGRKMSRLGRSRAALDMADLLETMWKKHYQIRQV
jgi:processive 1,2-diacylglycerol beta-glucosyltransferase